jgi:hypothetical protein
LAGPYEKLLRHVLENGTPRGDRTETRHDLLRWANPLALPIVRVHGALNFMLLTGTECP